MSSFVIFFALLSAASSFDFNFLSVPLLEVPEPMVAEIVRWNQPVCLQASVDLPACNPASTIADEFDSRNPQSSEDLESSSSHRATPELDISSESSSKIENAAASRREARFVLQRPMPIYVTKVLKVPVTATLVAKNCMPNIDLPLCNGPPVEVERCNTHVEREEMPVPPTMLQSFFHYFHKQPATTVSTDAQVETQGQVKAEVEVSADVESTSESQVSAKADVGASHNHKEWDKKTAFKLYIKRTVAELSKLWHMQASESKAFAEQLIKEQEEREAAAAKPKFTLDLETKLAINSFLRRMGLPEDKLDTKDWKMKAVVEHFVNKQQALYGKLMGAKESVAQAVSNVASGKKEAVNAVIAKKQEVLKTLVDKTQSAVQNIVNKTKEVVSSIVEKKTDLELQLADKKQQLVQNIASTKEKIIGGIASATQNVIQHVADHKIGAINKVSEKTQDIIGTVSLAKPLLVAPLQEKLGANKEVSASVGASVSFGDDFEELAEALDERSAAAAKEVEATESEEENLNGDAQYVVKTLPV